MAGTIKEAVTSGGGPPVQLITVVAHYDDVLRAPRVVQVWNGEPLVLGRGDADLLSGATFTLKDPRVSTRHAELRVEHGQVVVRDLGSSNGTFVDGQAVQGATPLDGNSVLEIGRTALVVRSMSAVRAAPLVAQRGVQLGALLTLHPVLGEVFLRLAKVAQSAQAVLFVGETGTGKEVLAQQVHALSQRSGALVAVDCGAIPDDLFESTLFGHEKGAFTGATEAREGEIERAHRGTLFLDEVGNLSAGGQAKLLRALETSIVTPLGSSKSQKVDVRWLAATNRLVLSKDDSFRSDLLHRLAGFVVTLPPLRERREDLGLLIAALLERAGVRQARLTPSAARTLFCHPLPGNVRQLRNVLQRAAHGGDDLVIDDDALGALELDLVVEPADVEDPRKGGRGRAPSPQELEAALRAADGVVAEAARAVGTSSRQLYRWLDKAGLDPERFRRGE